MVLFRLCRTPALSMYQAAGPATAFGGMNMATRSMTATWRVLLLFLSFTLSSAYAEPESPRFSDYPVSNISRQKPAAADFNTNANARRFQSAIRDGVKRGPNFAGHYTVITWGCGTMCQSFVIVDSITGEIFSSPFVTSTGICKRLDSNLLIVDPITSDVLENSKIPKWLTSRYYKWNEKELVLIKESKAILQQTDNCDNSAQPTDYPGVIMKHCNSVE